MILLSGSIGIVMGKKRQAKLQQHDEDWKFVEGERNVFSLAYREIPFEELLLKKELGRGSSGVVYRGIWRHATVAIKTIPVAFHEAAALEEWRSELEIITKLGNHPNILPFLGACTTQPSTLYLVTKFCDLGSLDGYLAGGKGISAS